MKHVKVTWYDALSVDAWTPIAEAKKEKPAKMITIGYLVAQNAHCIVVASSWNKENKEVGSYISIPAPWITSVIEIKDQVTNEPKSSRNRRK